MSKLQSVLNEGVAERDLPFVVGIVADKDGVLFSGAAGEAAPGREAAEDTLFRIFSMTKAIGSTAAMMLIDRGKLDGDTPVEDVLPAFADIQVLDGFDGDRPRLRAPKTKATVRQLATHTSGIEYEFWNGDVVTYMEKTGHPTVLSGTRASLLYPMMTDPGVRWGYGPGIDWLGLVVEAVAGRDLVRFCQEEIFDPLGMVDTCFEVPSGSTNRLAAIGLRGEDSAFTPIEIAPPANPEIYGMGHALYGTAPDYIRFLRMFLNGGELDGERILSEEALHLMLADQMRGLHFRKMVSSSALTADFDPFPGELLTHSFGFMRNEADIPGMRSAGSQSWAGVLNSHYWFDPKKNIAAVFMTQSLPFAEPRYMNRYGAFERTLYSVLR